MKKSKKMERAQQKRLEKFDSMQGEARISQTWKSSSHRPGSAKRK